MESELTPIEQKFWQASKNLIRDIQAQVWIEKYRVDFFIKSKNLIIELDGHDFHKTKEQRTNDAIRQRFLEKKGYRLIRFTGSEIYQNVDKCVKETIEFLEKLNNKIDDDDENDELFNIKDCQRMRDVITFLCIKHDLNLSSVENGYLELKLSSHFDNLSIEKNENLIAIMHTFILNGDVAYDPCLEFLIVSSSIDGLTEWIPMSIRQFAAPFLGFPEYIECININDYNENEQMGLIGNEDIKVIDEYTHNDIANFAEDWARTLILQGWLENSKLVVSY